METVAAQTLASPHALPPQVVDLAGLRTPEDYREQGRAHLFPSDTSLRWFIKRNRSRLIAADAVLMVAGRLMVAPAMFDVVVADVGRARMVATA